MMVFDLFFNMLGMAWDALVSGQANFLVFLHSVFLSFEALFVGLLSVLGFFDLA